MMGFFRKADGEQGQETGDNMPADMSAQTQQYSVPQAQQPVQPAPQQQSIAPAAVAAQPAAKPAQPVKAVTPNKITSLIAKTVRMEGNLTMKEGVKVEGVVIGNVDIEGEASTLLLAPGASIEGEVKVARAEVAGTIKGNLIAEQVTIFATGKVDGDISYTTLKIADGGEINGKIMKKKEYTDYQNVHRLSS